jgi:hypothetical protein
MDNAAQYAVVVKPIRSEAMRCDVSRIHGDGHGDLGTPASAEWKADRLSPGSIEKTALIVDVKVSEPAEQPATVLLEDEEPWSVQGDGEWFSAR